MMCGGEGGGDAQGTLSAAYTESDGLPQRAAERLWALLKLRAARYTMGDHASLPTAIMEELLASIVLTLEQGGVRGAGLATADLDAAFAAGQARIAAETARAKRLFQRACIGAPSVYSTSYRDTLKSIGGFFSRYDSAYFAANLPCEIDYQLLRPVAPDLRGVFYLSAYLRRIVTENAIVRLFEPGCVERLLTAYCGDYREQIVNLCEPVVVNALGLVLLGADMGALCVTRAQQARLIRQFSAVSERDARGLLLHAAEEFCRGAGVYDPAARDDLRFLSQELYPRIAAALSRKDLGGIFLAFA